MIATNFIVGPDLNDNAMASGGSSGGVTGPGEAGVMAQVTGNAVSCLMRWSGDEPGAWLAGLARTVRVFVRETVPSMAATRAAGVWAAVVAAGPSGEGWATRYSAVDGYADALTRQRVADLVAAGCPDDDLPRGVGAQGGLPWDGCRTRAQVLPDAEWRASGYRRARLARNLDEFCRLVLGVSEDDVPLRLVVQIDLPTDAEVDIRRVAEWLAVLGPFVQTAYAHRVAEPAQRRRAVLGRVTSAQRPIVQLLVQGHTEREIGKAVHRSPHTIHDHVKTIYANLGISSRHELLLLWHGLEIGRRDEAPAAPPADPSQETRPLMATLELRAPEPA